MSVTANPSSTSFQTIHNSFATSFAALETISALLQGSANQTHSEEILTSVAKITNSFDDCMKIITSYDPATQSRAFHSFADYYTSRTFTPQDDPNALYNAATLAFESEQVEEVALQLEEVEQWGKLNVLGKELAERMTEVFAQLFPFFPPSSHTPNNPTTCPLEIEPRLNPTVLTEAAVLASSPSPIAKQVEVTFTCNIASDKTVGICCGPDWGKAPIAFVKNRNQWKGRVPIDTEWKVVLLQGDRIVKWENGNNRRCDANTKPFSLHVKF